MPGYASLTLHSVPPPAPTHSRTPVLPHAHASIHYPLPQAARLGVRTRMIGKVGPDDFGRDYLKHLEQEEGVDISHVATAGDVSTGIAQITGTCARVCGCISRCVGLVHVHMGGCAGTCMGAARVLLCYVCSSMYVNPTHLFSSLLPSSSFTSSHSHSFFFSFSFSFPSSPVPSIPSPSPFPSPSPSPSSSPVPSIPSPFFLPVSLNLQSAALERILL